MTTLNSLEPDRADQLYADLLSGHEYPGSYPVEQVFNQQFLSITSIRISIQH